MKMMKAMQISAPGGDFELVERDIPQPKETQVRVKVLACGVCHGDAVVKEGGAHMNIEYPRIAGHEIIGLIDELGINVNGFKIGQRVGVGWPAGITYDGGFAEYMITEQEELVIIPEDLNDLEGAPLLCAGVTTYDALKNSGAEAGDIVAIQGIGGLGHLAVQYAKRLGFKTVVLSSSADKKELALKLGAQVFIDTQHEDVVKELQKLGGAKVILATAPDNKAISKLINALTFEGKLLIISGIEGPIEIFGGQLLNGRKSIQGWVASGPNARKDTIEFSLLNSVNAIVEIFPLEQVAEAYDKMMNAKVRFRAVLSIGGSTEK